MLMTKAYGVKPLVYTYTNFYNRYLVGALDEYKLFIVHNNKAGTVRRTRSILALVYTFGKAGEINGVNGYVVQESFNAI